MARCEVCGNDYDMAFEVHAQGAVHTFDSFENGSDPATALRRNRISDASGPCRVCTSRAEVREGPSVWGSSQIA